MKNSRYTAGFSMIEVLVAMLVLAVGILGFASLQLSSTSTNLEAYLRVQGTAIAEDMITRMTANRFYVNWDMRIPPSGTPGTDNIYVTTAPASNGFTCPAAGAAPRQCLGSDVGNNVCDEQQTATYDVWRVCRNADDLLPGGKVHITCADRPDITIGAGASAQVSPRGNPFPNSHPYFLSAENGGGSVITGTDNDTCSPGSRYSVYVSWLKAAAQTGAGETELVSSRCADIGLDATRDCVAIDVVP